MKPLALVARFAALIFAFLAVPSYAAMTYPGTVTVFPPGQSAAGCIQLPDGSFINPPTSTSCLQEAVNAMATYKGDLHIVGGADVALPGGAVVYNLSTGLDFPPMQGVKIRSGAVTLNYTADLGATPCVNIDAIMMVDIDLSGAQVVCQNNTSPAVLVKPCGPVPLDGIKVAIDSRIHITTIFNTGTQPWSSALTVDATCASDSSIGPITIQVDEANGGFNNIRVVGFNDKERVIGLRIISPHTHLAKNTAFLCQGKAKNSTFELGIQTESATVRGIDTYCSNNIFIGHVMGSTSAVGVLLESTAKNNRFMLTQIDGGVTTQAGATGNVFY